MAYELPIGLKAQMGSAIFEAEGLEHIEKSIRERMTKTLHKKNKIYLNQIRMFVSKLKLQLSLRLLRLLNQSATEESTHLLVAV